MQQENTMPFCQFSQVLAWLTGMGQETYSYGNGSSMSSVLVFSEPRFSFRLLRNISTVGGAHLMSERVSRKSFLCVLRTQTLAELNFVNRYRTSKYSRGIYHDDYLVNMQPSTQAFVPQRVHVQAF